MSYTNEDREQAIQDIFNPDKVTLWCESHGYFGPSKSSKTAPNMSCAKCWMVYYIHDIANTPASQRAERIDELEQVIHHMVETEQAGKWDFKVYEHPKIVISPDDGKDDSEDTQVEIFEN